MAATLETVSVVTRFTWPRVSHRRYKLASDERTAPYRVWRRNMDPAAALNRRSVVQIAKHATGRCHKWHICDYPLACACDAGIKQVVTSIVHLINLAT